MAPQDVKTGKSDNINRKNTLPDLDGKTWLRYSISVWDDLAKNTEERSIKHPAMFPAALTDRLVEVFYRRQKGMVLDPFLGSGSTLCSAYRFGIPSVGFEIAPEFLELAKKRLDQIPGDRAAYPRLIAGDARSMEEYLPPESAGLCITSPPYWDILQFWLVESRNKRCGFLQRVIEELNLDDCFVVWDRIEKIAHQKEYRGTIDCAVARAVAPLSVLLELGLPFLRRKGVLIALKGHAVIEEIKTAGRALEILGGAVDQVIPYYFPGEKGRNVVVVSKERETPLRFPRKPGTPAKKPL